MSWRTPSSSCMSAFLREQCLIEITDEQRTELLDQLDELSTQAAIPQNKRVKPGVTKAILTGLATGMSAAGGLAEMWSTWSPAIRTFFGF